MCLSIFQVPAKQIPLAWISLSKRGRMSRLSCMFRAESLKNWTSVLGPSPLVVGQLDIGPREGDGLDLVKGRPVSNQIPRSAMDIVVPFRLLESQSGGRQSPSGRVPGDPATSRVGQSVLRYSTRASFWSGLGRCRRYVHRCRSPFCACRNGCLFAWPLPENESNPTCSGSYRSYPRQNSLGRSFGSLEQVA